MNMKKKTTNINTECSFMNHANILLLCCIKSCSSFSVIYSFKHHLSPPSQIYV